MANSVVHQFQQRIKMRIETLSKNKSSDSLFKNVLNQISKMYTWAPIEDERLTIAELRKWKHWQFLEKCFAIMSSYFRSSQKIMKSS